MPFLLRRLKFISFMNNQFRRYLSYAIGEIVLIILGILIALQIDTWKTERVARQEERGYLIRLSADMGESVTTARVATDWLKTVASRGAVVLKSLETCTIKDEDKFDFANGLYHLGKVSPPYVNDGTIQEMQVTGKLSLIQSVTIRTNLNSYLAWHRYVMGFWDGFVERGVPRMVYMTDQITYFRKENPSVKQEIRFEDMGFDLEKLCKDRRFYGSVASSRLITYQAIFWNEVNVRRLEYLDKVVDEELERLGIDKDQITPEYLPDNT